MYHTIKATVWQCTPEGATIKVFTPIGETAIEKSIDVENLRDETLKMAFGQVVFDAVIASVRQGNDLMDDNLEIRIKLNGKSAEVVTNKTY